MCEKLSNKQSSEAIYYKELERVFSKIEHPTRIDDVQKEFMSNPMKMVQQ